MRYNKKKGTMKTTLLLLLLAGLIHGQSVGVSAPNNVRTGQSFQLSISKSGGGSPAALEFTISFSGGVASISNIVEGTAATGAGKSVDCSTFTVQAIKCVLWGLNNQTMTDGVLTTMRASVVSSGAPQQITVTIGALLGASVTASAITFAANPPVTVSVLSKCDINGDGLTNATDAALMRDELLSRSPTVSDINGDGSVNVVDMRIVEIAAIGGVCQ